jgi:hypothetical protein
MSIQEPIARWFCWETQPNYLVNLDISPALDTQTLSLNYNKEVEYIELDEVMRQEEDSGILHNATELREIIERFFHH